MAYVEDLDSLEDVEDLNNCSDDENQELHEQIEPKVGMEFDGIVELYEFYKKYAKNTGFPMRKQSSKKNVEGNLRSVTLSCSRGGKRRITSQNPLKSQASCRSCRIGCTAYLTARLNLHGSWEITVVALDHNHKMSPGKSRFFRCNRKIGEHGKSVSSSSAIAMVDAFKLGFVGAGNMAESIARGVARSGVLPPSSIRTAHRRPDRRDAFQSFGIEIVETNSQVVDDSDIIILSVKPQMVKNVLLELKPSFSDEKLLVSVAAGIKLKELQEWSGHRRVIRVMPNTPSAVGEAASVMCMGEMATKRDEERVSCLFSAIGRIWTTDEKYFDAVTGLSGSGPAYIFLAIEALADGGVAAGLPRDLALGLASQTVLGAAAMVTNTGKHPGQLKDAVTSPAGTTISGVHELERGGFRGTLMSAVVAATKRCRELSQM